MAEKPLIIGAGGHGKVVADILWSAGIEPAGFIDADESLWGTPILDLPVLGGIAHLEELARHVGSRSAVVAIGDNRLRLEHAREVVKAGLSLQSAIHPSAMISPRARLGAGVVACMGSAICVEARIGDLAIVNTNAVVDHECNVGEAAHVCPNATLAGRVQIGQGAFIGTGASIIQCRRVGEWATIGAGSAVIADIPHAATAVGVPARIIRGEQVTLPRVVPK